MKNNIANITGGGMVLKEIDNVEMNDILVAGNEALQGGGIEIVNADGLELENLTIADNIALESIGGAIGSYSGSFSIVNSIIYENGPQAISFYPNGDPCSITASYSDIEGGQDSIATNDNGTVTWGEGNIDIDPMFVDADNNDYYLTADSRLIDAGHPDSTDTDGTISDMGAYYYDQAGQPVRVSNLITTPSAENVSVRWNANTSAASYNIYRSTDGSADFYSLSPYTFASDTSYVDESVDDNTTYHYRVSAVPCPAKRPPALLLL